MMSLTEWIWFGGGGGSELRIKPNENEFHEWEPYEVGSYESTDWLNESF